MSAARQVNLTIDGHPVQAVAGQTVYEAASAAGINIPALCHHPKLPPLGACRLCVVEIDGQRALQPACTFPVADGLVIRTETPKLRANRIMALQLLFAERGHYCMYCPMSGTIETTDCELQKLGYQLGMTSWPYPPDTAKRWPMDGSHPNMVIDHGRCILCRRCVRACDVLAAAHTLGVHYRGARAMIGADEDVPLGKSTCVACGTCIQVCPTGAITDRRSSYGGHEAEVRHVASMCLGCAAGCSIKASVRDNHLLRIDGDWTGNSLGLLCERGRFKAAETSGTRIRAPRIRDNGGFIETSWDEALAAAAKGFSGVPVAGLISPRLPSEALAAFTCFFNEILGSDQVSLMYGDIPPLDLGRPAMLSDLAASDCIIVIGQDPIVQHPVVGYLIKRAFDRGARVVVVDDENTTLDPYAALHLHLEEISSHAESPFARLKNIYHLKISGLKQLSSAVGVAQRPVVVYGWGLTATVYAGLRALPDRCRFLPLVHGPNTRGAARLGLGARATEGQAMLAMLADEPPVEGTPSRIGFLVVQAAYESPWTAAADVVLPARTWSEQSGHFTNLEGRTCRLESLTAPPSGARGEGDALRGIALRLGRDLAYEEICRVLAGGSEGETR